MELPKTFPEFLVWALFGIGGIAAGFLHRSGRTHKPPPDPAVVVSGALMSDAAVDPLLTELRRQIVVTERLCDLMEKEVGLRTNAVEESRKREDQKAMALAIADQVREDILEEMRREIQNKSPAPMPPARKRPT